MWEGWKLSKNITLVCSMQKAGTHLLGKLLEAIGIVNSELFLTYADVICDRNENYGDNRTQVKLFEPGRPINWYSKINVSPVSAIQLVKSGSYVLSHETPRSIEFTLWPMLNILVLVRPFREIMLSEYNAFLKLKNGCNNIISPEFSYEEIESFKIEGDFQGKFERYVELRCPTMFMHYCDLFHWSFVKNALFIKFYDLIQKDNKEMIENICKHVGGKMPSNKKIFEKVYNTQNSTKNDINHNLIWSNRAETVFINNGLDKLEDKFNKLFE